MLGQIPLIDTIPLKYEMLEENFQGKKKIRLKGILSEGDVKNRNNRIYPTNLLEREINRLTPDIQERKVVGELDHPDDLKIHLDRVSHLVVEAGFNGAKLQGSIEVIDEIPCGKVLAGLIKAGVQLGISSRAMGSVQRNNDGVDIVQEDFTLLTWDVVAQPSNYTSWLTLAEAYQTARNKNISSLDDILNNNLNSNENIINYFFK